MIILLFLVATQLHSAVWYYGSGEATSLENVLGFDKLPNVKIEATGLNLLMRPDAAGDVLKRTNTDLDNSLGKEFRGKRNFYVKGDADFGKTSDLTSGNNATFDNGGVLAGSLAIDTGSLIDGVRSYEFTQAAGSLNDWVSSEVVALPSGYQGELIGFNVAYKYDGTDDDITLRIKCSNTSTIYTPVSGTVLIKNTGATGSNNLSGIFLTETTCTGIQIGFHVIALDSGSVLSWDEANITPETSVVTFVSSGQSAQSHHSGNGWGGSSSGDATTFNFLTRFQNTGGDITYVARTATTADKWSIVNTGIYHISTSLPKGAGGQTNVCITRNSAGASDPNGAGATFTSSNADTVPLPNRICAALDGSFIGLSNVSVTWLLNAGDVIRAQGTFTETTTGTLHHFSITRGF